MVISVSKYFCPFFKTVSITASPAFVPTAPFDGAVYAGVALKNSDVDIPSDIP